MLGAKSSVSLGRRDPLVREEGPAHCSIIEGFDKEEIHYELIRYKQELSKAVEECHSYSGPRAFLSRKFKVNLGELQTS